MNILFINGFGQQASSLESAFKDLFDAKHNTTTLDYLQYANFDALVDDYKPSDVEIDVVIAWSLGSQVAIRLIEKQLLKTRFLVLIASPFQLVANEINNVGQPQEAFAAFANALSQYPTAALDYLAAESATNDMFPAKVLQNMQPTDNIVNLGSWLQEMKDFSCFNVDFANFPKTLYLGGVGDKVVSSTQATLFADRIANSEVYLVENCGHAPQFSHPEEVQLVLTDRLSNNL